LVVPPVLSKTFLNDFQLAINYAFQSLFVSENIIIGPKYKFVGGVWITKLLASSGLTIDFHPGSIPVLSPRRRLDRLYEPEASTPPLQ